MSNDITATSPSTRPIDTSAVDGASTAGPTARTSEDTTLPPPLSPASGDDLMTALAMLTIQQRHEQRVSADQQRAVAAKAQEEAQAEKISKMRELADDTFLEGVVTGALTGAAAAASAASACTEYSSTTTACGMQRDTLKRDAGILSATSRGFEGASKLAGASVKSDQDDDRADMAVADGAVERAKSAVDAASSEARKADEDARETMNAIRQYLAAKSQLANAAIIRG